ncbi:hypothetical protein BX600DRAFT_73650 [Xylariales sp. PMI_506]|nr:hypothetical protein BX600DRAFT_73650 [Xylariales sp. PMI_506]
MHKCGFISWLAVPSATTGPMRNGVYALAPLLSPFFGTLVPSCWVVRLVGCRSYKPILSGLPTATLRTHGGRCERREKMRIHTGINGIEGMPSDFCLFHVLPISPWSALGDPSCSRVKSWLDRGLAVTDGEGCVGSAQHKISDIKKTRPPIERILYHRKPRPPANGQTQRFGWHS